MPSTARPMPGINRDTQFFWDGLNADKILVQRCCDCQQLRHPPGPVCMHCHSFNWDTQALSGKGLIYSFVTMHHPALPAFESPNPIGLIELDEGVRLVGGLVDFAAEEIRIGAAVQGVIRDFDNGLRLLLFRPA